MTALNLDAIEARANAATKGPWDLHRKGILAGVTDPDGDGYIAEPPLRWTDAEFIAAARQDVPALVAEVRRLSQRPSVEDVARVFAGLGDDEPWPSNWELGGSTTGTRDDEFRSAHMADARRLLALFPTPIVQGESA
jgi:hypothetical protein